MAHNIRLLKENLLWGLYTKQWLLCLYKKQNLWLIAEIYYLKYCAFIQSTIISNTFQKPIKKHIKKMLNNCMFLFNFIKTCKYDCTYFDYLEFILFNLMIRCMQRLQFIHTSIMCMYYLVRRLFCTEKSTIIFLYGYIYLTQTMRDTSRFEQTQETETLHRLLFQFN